MARVVMNIYGINALMKSPEVEADLRRRADTIASTAGDGFEADSGQTRYVARASVRTVTVDAMRREARDKVLATALDAGRM